MRFFLAFGYPVPRSVQYAVPQMFYIPWRRDQSHGAAHLPHGMLWALRNVWYINICGIAYCTERGTGYPNVRKNRMLKLV